MLRAERRGAPHGALDAMKARAPESGGASIVITLAHVGVHHGRTACAASARD